MMIYKITNMVNGKLYIGKTERSLQRRFNRHIQDALSGRLNTVLSKAIRKYGSKNFKISCIEEVYDKNLLERREKYWIEYYDTVNLGYNMTCGGDGGNTYTNKSEKEMKCIKEKIRKAKTGSKNPNSTKVKCINVITNEEHHFDTLKECEDFFGEKQHNFITRRCKNTTNCLYKGVWNIAYENDEYIPRTTYKHNRRMRMIDVFNLKTGENKQFHSYAQAERYYKLRPKSLSGHAYKYQGKTFTMYDCYQITVIE